MTIFLFNRHCVHITT